MEDHSLPSKPASGPVVLVSLLSPLAGTSLPTKEPSFAEKFPFGTATSFFGRQVIGAGLEQIDGWRLGAIPTVRGRDQKDK